LHDAGLILLWKRSGPGIFPIPIIYHQHNTNNVLIFPWYYRHGSMEQKEQENSPLSYQILGKRERERNCKQKNEKGA
jgi:hypothetical protein